MKRFLVQYKLPLAMLDGWMQTPKENREAEEEKMKNDWQDWASANKKNILETHGAGKTKWVDINGIEDFRNEIMLVSIMQAGSKEELSKLLKTHPHLQIPKAWIEITDLTPAE